MLRNSVKKYTGAIIHIANNNDKSVTDTSNIKQNNSIEIKKSSKPGINKNPKIIIQNGINI